ncbi:MAG: PAS domain S-box protein, partial [Microcystaceae cyanobacterium]
MRLPWGLGEYVARQVMRPLVTVTPATTVQSAQGLIQPPVSPYLVVVGDRGEFLGIVGQGQLLASLVSTQRTVCLLQTLINSLQAGILLSDRQGHLLLDNGYLSQLTGYAPPTNLYHLLALMLAEPDQYQTVLQAINSSSEPGEVKTLEMTILTRDRQLKTLMIDLVHLWEQEQDLILTVYYDISEQKQAEQKLRNRTQQLHETQQFARLGSW